MEHLFNIIINNHPCDITCKSEETLLNYLREELRLTGTKCGCGIGVCGTCTVLIDGKAKRACRVKMKDLKHEGRTAEITTIESLEKDGKLHPIQQAFIDCGAIQCGFCTPGMIMQTLELLTSNPNPSREEIKKALATNLCRCTGYQQIFDAVEEAAKQMQQR